jgi:hypothetical protein
MIGLARWVLRHADSCDGSTHQEILGTHSSAKVQGKTPTWA